MVALDSVLGIELVTHEYIPINLGGKPKDLVMDRIREIGVGKVSRMTLRWLACRTG